MAARLMCGEMEFWDGEGNVDELRVKLKRSRKSVMSLPDLLVILTRDIVANGDVAEVGAADAGEEDIIHVHVSKSTIVRTVRLRGLEKRGTYFSPFWRSPMPLGRKKP